MSLRSLALGLGAISLVACSDVSTPFSPLRPEPASRSLSTASLPVASEYTITDLGTLGGVSASAWAVNGQGHVVGAARVASGTLHAFLWVDGQMTDLGTLGGSASQARALNDHDVVVGDALTADATRHAFEWTAAAGMRDLGSVGDGISTASGVNDRGDVVGWVTFDIAHADALYWPAGHSLQDLGTFGPGAAQFGGINARGEAALGTNLGPCNHSVTYRWDAQPSLLEPMTNLDSPTDDPCGGAAAMGINDVGTIVGGAGGPGSTTVGSDIVGYPYVWSPLSATPVLLTSSDIEGVAFAINNSGTVAGWIDSDAFPQTAFVWTPKRGLALLPKSGFKRTVARGINDRGDIVGWAVAGGVQHAVMWAAR